MKKYYIYVFIIFTLLLMPNMVSAAGLCEYKLLSDYRSLAGNVNITYSYRMEDGKPVFDVTISNIYDDMYVKDVLLDKTYTEKDVDANNEIVIKGYRDDLQLKYQIYTTVAGCYGQLLTTKYVTLPNYNEFSADEACVGAEEYSLCQRWGAVSVDYETFIAKVAAYKERKAAQGNEIVFNKNKTLLEKIFAFVGNYYVYLVSLIIIIILGIAALKKIFLKKNQFDFRV